MKTVLKSDLENVEIQKIDKDQRLVTYWANVTKYNDQIVVDADNEYIETEDLRLAMIEFMKFSGVFCKNHKREQCIGKVVEAITFTKELKDILGVEMPEEGALVTVFIYDNETWEAIKAGNYTMASIGGRATHDEIGE